MAARVLAVLKGNIKPLGSTVSGIDKILVEGPQRVERLGLVGDAQADLRVHGGEDKAVHCYAWFAHRALPVMQWRRHRSRQPKQRLERRHEHIGIAKSRTGGRMKPTHRATSTVVTSVGLLLVQCAAFAQVPDADGRGYMAIPETGGVKGESKDVQIARAVAAGPATVTRNARIVGTDSSGKSVVLREGSNGFLCQPGDPNVIGRPATCSNEAARQWSSDLAAGKPSPTNTVLGIIYMQAGATERGPAGETIKIGPQWIVTWPFDPKASGLSATKKDTGAYIRWAGTPYAHLNIMGQAVGTPSQHLASEHAGHMPAMGVHDGSARSAPTNESAEVQSARAISAGPKHVTDGARLMGVDAQGKEIVLREGNNGFVCNAGSLRVVADPPTCRSTKSKPAIWYMLAGATQRSVTDPNDENSPSLAIAPHWMIMTKFDPKTTGIPEHYSDVGAYAMWVNARSAHLHINGIP